MKNMKILKISLFALVLLGFVLTVNATNFSGYTYNTTEGALNATNVTIEIWNDETSELTLNTSYSALSNASGYWNITIPDSELVTGKSVKFVPRHYVSGVYADYVGAILPPFPSEEITEMLNASAINFYLKGGATINISAVNVSGGSVNFTYMVKDTRLGFPISSDWTNYVYQKVIYLPADRNYSIEIFPFQRMPIYYDLNNLSAYPTPKIVNITFNTTTSAVRVTGRFNLSNGTGIFDEMNIINYLLEPGSMVFMGQAMPYNMSAWYGLTDTYNTVSGEYNISLEGTAMSSKVLMFAIAKSGNDYYGAFRNISPTISGGDINGFNFTLYKLLGSPTNITVNQGTGGNMNVTASKTTFAFVNASNVSLTTATGHIEVELQYSGINGNLTDFTWMLDVQQSDQGSFTLPLLNYSIKKLNMFTQNYAPLKLKYTAAQLASNINITLRPFNPGGIDSDFSGIQMKMFKSSAECDVPSPPSSCDLAGTGGEKAEDDFKPLNAVISGGKLSLRIKKGSIVIHYKNVDMIASGPPDAAFDQSASSSTSGSTQEEIWRFGSLGPEIYDSLLIGFPYSGIDDSYDINVSLPYLYDNSWTMVWNTSANGTTGIGANLTDYADYNTNWFSGINCSKTNQTANCFVNTTTNIIWMQLPHFTGVGPSTRGTASSSGGSSSSGGGGGGSATYQCNDGKDNDKDGLIDYPKDPDCATKYDNNEGELKKGECKENWICTSWSECSKEGKQTRICTDYGKCDTVKEKPIIEKTCTYTSLEQPTISEEEEKEGIPLHALAPLKKRTYNWIFTVLGAALIALIALALIIKKKSR